MIEIERKFRLTSAKKAAIEKELLRKYNQATPVRQIDEIFLEGIDSFKNFKQGMPITRLRTQGSTTTLTYKRQLNNSGDMLEHEVIVESANTMREILLAMDYRSVTKVDKIRLEIKTDTVTFALDTVKGLGDFLEIEVLAKDERSLAKTEKVIMAKAAELDLSRTDLEPKKYDKMIAELGSI